MVDINFIRDYPDKIKEAIKNKNINLDIDKLLEIDNERRESQTKLDSLRQRRNEVADMAKGGKPTQEAIDEGKNLKAEIYELEGRFNEIEKQYMELMVQVPTVPSSDTPVGKNDNENVQTFTWGVIPKFDFTPKTHLELGKELDILDMEKGAKAAGYRGYYIKNEGSILVLAFMMYAMHKMVAKGYAPMIPPTLVKEFTLFGSGYFKGWNMTAKTIIFIRSQPEIKKKPERRVKIKSFWLERPSHHCLLIFQMKL